MQNSRLGSVATTGIPDSAGRTQPQILPFRVTDNGSLLMLNAECSFTILRSPCRQSAPYHQTPRIHKSRGTQELARRFPTLPVCPILNDAPAKPRSGSND